LTIELTEGATLAVIHLLDALTRLRIKGAHLSLDDFGTGYSSLVQLHELPFSEMKIDRSFVMGMDTTKECRTIVKSIIDLAHNLDLKVVAEGVETATALRQLKALGCDVAQGYFIARPMPAAYLPGWLEKVSSNSR
jgi:EAL domain-containing protein (putative c-di-GMP-specific phosphodiesterase class I)